VEAIERKAEALCRRQEDVSLKKWLDNQNLLQTGRCRETAAIVALS
jgi:hypothetical protein